MSQPAIEVFLGDVTDVEARVYARCVASEESAGAEVERIVVRGTLRGPYCEKARTLPVEFAFRDVERAREAVAEAMVTDPCMWSPELPHLYRVDVEALQGTRVVAEHHGTIGLRRLAPRRPVDFAPGTG